jgi:probable rRNA maturation factor
MVLNQQKKVRVETAPLEAFLAGILRELNLASSEVGIALVSDAEIAKWNKKYLCKTGPTDVLSFPALSAHRAARFTRTKGTPGKRPPSSGGWLGDVAISPETARKYAEKNGRSLDDELRVLMLHGVLHLLGYDHGNPTDYGQMDRVEKQLRRRLGIA